MLFARKRSVYGELGNTHRGAPSLSRRSQAELVNEPPLATPDSLQGSGNASEKKELREPKQLS
eukprot:12266816-Alexandrium_andersonii.AAC.1